MSAVKITLKDGSVREVEQGTSVFAVAKEISGRLAKEAIVAEVDGKTVDLSYVIDKDIELNILKFDSEEGEHALMRNIWPKIFIFPSHFFYYLLVVVAI